MKLPRHDEMLATSIQAFLGGERLDESLSLPAMTFFRWVAKTANNWPVIATALLSVRDNKGGLEMLKAQKASTGSMLRLAMGYLISHRDITPFRSVMAHVLATTIVMDNYTLKAVGLVLHNRKDRNAAIEKLYKVTQDDQLLMLMNDTALENTLADELGL